MLYLLFYLFLEIMTTSTFTQSYGGFLFFLEIIFSFIIGLSILKHYKKSFQDDVSSVMRQQMNMQDFQSKQIFTLIGAVLLMIPGIFTDGLGLFMQIEILAMPLVKILLKNKFKINTNQFDKENQNANHFEYTKKTKSNQGDIIDVEVIDTKSINK